MVHDENFTFKSWITRVKYTVVSEDQKKDVLDELMVYIFIGVAFVLFVTFAIILSICCVKKIKDKIRNKLK